jgi:hypothetical protein
MDAQLRETVTDLVSNWLDIFATSLTITHRSSRWRYVRFRGCVNGSTKRVTLVRLMISPPQSVTCACGGKSPRPSPPSYKVYLVVRMKVALKWKAMLQRLLLKAIAERYGIDYNLSWLTTHSTPSVQPISEQITR